MNNNKNINKNDEYIKTEAIIPESLEMDSKNAIGLWNNFKEHNKRRNRGIFILGFLLGCAISFLIFLILIWQFGFIMWEYETVFHIFVSEHSETIPLMVIS
jgi:hypothetical protein